MHKDSGWRPDTGCQQCNGHETWTHNAAHEINDGQRDPEVMDLGLDDAVDDEVGGDEVDADEAADAAAGEK